MFRAALLVLLGSLATAHAAAPASVIETRMFDSAILRDNLVGLNPQRRLKIYLPPGYAQGKQRYPVVYFLHSINWDNERMFASGTAAQPTYDRAIADGVIKPFILVAPDYTTPSLGTFFANSPVVGRFEDHTVQEVVPFIDANYRTLARADSRAITGDFMGAYGALRYAFRHPDVFSVVYGMHPVGAGSGVEPTFQRPDWERLQRAKSYADLTGPFDAVFAAMMQTFLPNPQRPPLYCDFMVDVVEGRRTVNAANVQRVKQGFFLDNIAVAEVENLRRLRAIKFDWGRYDPTDAHVFSNRILTRNLHELGIAHEAEEFGGTPWDQYWEGEERVYREVLPFLARGLRF